MIIFSDDITTLIPWWGILIIVILLLAGITITSYFFNKRNKKQQNILENKENKKDNSPSKPIKDEKNTPYWGIYNWFGKKQALRTTVLVYVEEVEDPCPLCRPFENKVLSLEKYGKNVTTMSEAISRGYHHVGCKHIDLDYFHGSTIVPNNKWTKEEKELKYLLRLKQYKLEEEIRNLKFSIDNENKTNKQNELILQLKSKQKELDNFCKNNKLIRNEKRENYNISEIEKFS